MWTPTVPLADGIRVGLSLVLFVSLSLLVGANSLVGDTFSADCTCERNSHDE